jgi:hypothetical protein
MQNFHPDRSYNIFMTIMENVCSGVSALLELDINYIYNTYLFKNTHLAPLRNWENVACSQW